MNEKVKRTCKLDLTSGNVVDIHLPQPLQTLQPSCFSFSLHKAGSSLLSAMLANYSNRLSLPLLDLPTLIIRSGQGEIGEVTKESFNGLFRSVGYLYGGWRSYSACLADVDFSSTRNILLVRDPRDRLISQYFSFGYSHKLPPKGPFRDKFLANREKIVSRTISEHVIAFTPWISEPWNLYHERLTPSTTRIYRYEDIIFQKQEWLADIIDFFGLPYDENHISEVATASDIRPDKEKPQDHIRQVTPGNHVKHLSTDVIERLNQDMKQFLDAYDYHNPVSFGDKLVFAREGMESQAIFQQFQTS